VKLLTTIGESMDYDIITAEEWREMVAGEMWPYPMVSQFTPDSEIPAIIFRYDTETGQMIVWGVENVTLH